MRILIIEDNEFKLSKLAIFIRDWNASTEILTARSVSSGKEKLRTEKIDLVLLDMSLPAFDERNQESGGTPQNYGGRELLGYIDYLENNTPAIIVTMFESFGPPGKNTDLETLQVKLSAEYPEIFKGLIFYSQISDIWKNTLSEILFDILGDTK